MTASRPQSKALRGPLEFAQFIAERRHFVRDRRGREALMSLHELNVSFGRHSGLREPPGLGAALALDLYPDLHAAMSAVAPQGRPSKRARRLVAVSEPTKEKPE